jgi:hypothetical protein
MLEGERFILVLESALTEEVPVGAVAAGDSASLTFGLRQTLFCPPSRPIIRFIVQRVAHRRSAPKAIQPLSRRPNRPELIHS